MAYPRPLIRDISKYDPEVLPWNDYDAFIVRCFDGTHIDNLFESHRRQIIQAGKPWWPYMFYDFRFPAAPQIPSALMILGAEDGNQALCIDVEEWSIYKFPPHDTLLANMKILHDAYLSMTGIRPMWYFSSIAVIHEHLMPVPEWLRGDPLWIANWGTYLPEYDPWDTWIIHQYQGDPDLNQFNGTPEEFNLWLQGEWNPPTIPEWVTVNVANVNLRTEPYGNISGYTNRGKRLKVLRKTIDANGDEWYDVQICIAGWLVNPV